MDTKIYFTADVFGMCGGVHAALNTLEKLVDSSGGGVYVFNELVHNRSVTESFVRKGVKFVSNTEDIPFGVPLVIGAHGVSPEVEKALRSRASQCLDATCPLVKKLHHIAESVSGADELIIFGKSGHPEVQGVAGYSGTEKLFIISDPAEAIQLPELKRPVFISQTTVDHEEVEKVLTLLKERFPNLRESSGICDASKKRQAAVVALAEKVEVVLVIGSNHSSNAKRLREIAERSGCWAYLIDNAAELSPAMLDCRRIGVTGGASTPQYLFDEVITALEKAGFNNGKEL